MVSVFMIGVADIAWRLRDYTTSASTPFGIRTLLLAAAAGLAWALPTAERSCSGTAPALRRPALRHGRGS